MALQAIFAYSLWAIPVGAVVEIGFTKIGSNTSFLSQFVPRDPRPSRSLAGGYLPLVSRDVYSPHGSKTVGLGAQFLAAIG